MEKIGDYLDAVNFFVYSVEYHTIPYLKERYLQLNRVTFVIKSLDDIKGKEFLNYIEEG